MKKHKMFTFVLVVAMLLAGCNHPQSSGGETLHTSENQTKNHVLAAWTGEFTEDKLQKAIKEYQEHYTPFDSDKPTGITKVSFETDFDILEYSVSRLSSVDDSDANIELNGYIDSSIQTEQEGRKISVDTGWWYSSDGWTQNFPVWSYLVHVKDSAGTVHYYYFRVMWDT